MGRMDRHTGPNQAIIREALKADQSNRDTWPKISPKEASSIRLSYHKADDEILALRTENDVMRKLLLQFVADAEASLSSPHTPTGE